MFFFRRGLGGISSSHRWLETSMILRVVIFQPWHHVGFRGCRLWGDKGATAEAGHTLVLGWVEGTWLPITLQPRRWQPEHPWNQDRKWYDIWMNDDFLICTFCRCYNYVRFFSSYYTMLGMDCILHVLCYFSRWFYSLICIGNPAYNPYFFKLISLILPAYAFYL